MLKTYGIQRNVGCVLFPRLTYVGQAHSVCRFLTENIISKWSWLYLTEGVRTSDLFKNTMTLAVKVCYSFYQADPDSQHLRGETAKVWGSSGVNAFPLLTCLPESSNSPRETEDS